MFRGGKVFAVLGVISENFSLELVRPPYSYSSLIHFGSVCKSAKFLFAPRNI